MPKKVDPAQRRDHPVLVRLTAQESDWLEGAAFLERTTVNSYIRALLQAHVLSLKSNQHVAQVVSNRDSYQAAQAATAQHPAARPANRGTESA